MAIEDPVTSMLHMLHMVSQRSLVHGVEDADADVKRLRFSRRMVDPLWVFGFLRLDVHWVSMVVSRSYI